MIDFFKRLFGKREEKQNSQDLLDNLIQIYLRKNGLVRNNYIPTFVEHYFYKKLLNIALEQLNNKEIVLYGFKLQSNVISNEIVSCLYHKKKTLTKLTKFQTQMISNILNAEIDNSIVREILYNFIIITCCFLFDTIQLLSFSCMGIKFKLIAQRDKDFKKNKEKDSRVLSQEEIMHINEIACDFTNKISDKISIPFLPNSYEEHVYHQSFTSLIYIALKLLNEVTLVVFNTNFNFDTKLLEQN